MANPSGNQEGSNNSDSSGGGTGAVSNGVSNPSDENSKVSAVCAEKFRQVEKQLRHCPKLAMIWTTDEQSILEEGLLKCSSEPTITRYANIVKLLEGKTMRDVVIRCRWMKNQKESGKRKTEDHNLTRKSRDKKEKITKSSSQLSQPIPQQAAPMSPMNIDDGISYQAIDDAAGQLMEKNSQHLNQIVEHLRILQIQENTNLFTQVWNNIHTVMNDPSYTSEAMKQMPPLSTKMNAELFKAILPKTHL